VPVQIVPQQAVMSADKEILSGWRIPPLFYILRPPCWRRVERSTNAGHILSVYPRRTSRDHTSPYQRARI